MLRLGYKASAEQFGPRELLDFAVAAEGHGFESVFVSDHFQPWRHSDGHAPFAFAWLAATGERTKHVALGTSVVTPTFRYHPAVVAQAFGTLGTLFPNRVILGVGTGEHLNEGALGIAWPDNKERFARLREAVKLIRLLWTDQSVTFDGDYYHTRNATIYDRPAEPLPIYVGAGGPQVAKFAGRAGEGLICTSGKGMELYSEQLLPSFADGARESGRDADRLDRMIEVKVSYDTDRSRAMEDTKIWAALALPAEEKAGVDDPREMERLARGVEEVAHRRWLVSDDPDEHIEQLKPYLDLGFNHLVFHAPGDDQLRFLKLYGEQILPRLRKQWGG
ncbi:MAG TPA: glucose-6-phosphate dehydrogenase (coenzyme-F420) [Candidatus Dormibacteraeota bacterium]|nr:glucose-6-phosphate dehydrogenase (coenzyme-F420) [Candidatus Dormibacteraeota bacterium]